MIVVSVAPRFKFNAKESIGGGTGAPVVRGQMSGRVLLLGGENGK